jgi:hypothetical protein
MFVQQVATKEKRGSWEPRLVPKFLSYIFNCIELGGQVRHGCGIYISIRIRGLGAIV